ncbi:hypothetical protein [Sorangium sp. So ce204]|uniref:hypothetical protein n=1 Tax=Sorangium sp. So ce204 TaxID=3133288 RepID=UPI003F5DDCA9
MSDEKAQPPAGDTKAITKRPRKTPAPREPVDDVEPIDQQPTDRASVVAHLGLVVLLAAVLWVYRAADYKVLGVAVSGVVVALIAVRFDRIKKLTSKLVTFETRPAVDNANAAATRANKAAKVADAKAEAAHGAALEVDARVKEIDESLAEMRKLAVATSHVALDVLARTAILGAMPWSQKFELRGALRARLEALGISAEDITRADAYFVSLARYRLVHHVIFAAREECKARQGGKADAVYMAFQQRTIDALSFEDDLRVPDRAGLVELVSEYDCDAVRAALADLDHWDATGTLTSPDLLDRKLR